MNKACLYIFIVFTLFGSHFASTQSINQLNKFLTYNYTNDDFNSTVQIWGGSQLVDGSFVFGNDRKIVHFDGEDWQHIPSIKEDTLSQEDNKVFSLFSASDTTIYVGRKNVFGKLVYDSIGKIVFQPLIKDSSITNVWSIYENADQNIIFTTPTELILYNPLTEEQNRYSLKSGKDKALIESSVILDQGILITFSKEVEINAPKEKFVYYFSFEDFTFTELDSKINVRASYKNKQDWNVVDYSGSVYNLNLKKKTITETHQLKFEDQTIHVNQILMRNNLLWTATERYGVLIFDINGKLLRSLGGSEGLQDNNVFRMFFDNSSNLWLCLDNGISAVNLNPPMSRWARKDGLEGAVEAFISYEDSLFMMASRSGIFKSKIEKEKIIFSNTHTLNEAAYDIKRFSTDFGERIVVVGYNGIYDVTNSDKEAIVMALSIYGWELHPSPFQHNELFIGGEDFIGKFTYLGAGKWDFKKIKETPGDIIKFIEYKEQLLFSVKGTGIFSIDKNNAIEQIPISKTIDISGSHFFLEEHKDNIYAGYNRGLLKLNKTENEFQSIYIPGLGSRDFDLNFHRLYSHPLKDELFAVVFNETPNNESKHVGYIQKEADQYSWHPMAISVLKKGIIYDIKADANHVFFGMNNGFAAVNRKHLEETKNPWEVYISKVGLNDQGISYNIAKAQKLQAIKHGKSIRFDVRANQYFGDGNIRYRFRLKGVSDKWSTFEKNSYKIYDQLPAGKYTIQFQGVNQYDTKSEIANYTFTILPPWYQTWWAYTLYALAFIIIVYLIILVSIYRVKQKNKNLERIVNERTKEIAEKNEVLEIQKNEISEINSDLLGSINYAKRIQNTILPSKSSLDELFNDYFTFYLPKDIVSGDIYWAQKFDRKIIWSAIDCTGHGVPGAFVSIVGNNTLMRSTKEFGLREPAKILDKQRELVIEAFQNEEQKDVKDGMDLALVALDLDTLKLEYAGANNPLVIVRDGEVIEIKADKEPIGEFVKMTPFTNHEIQMQKGDCVYLFSDGYVDQFGGEKNKKFKSKPFKRLLCDIAPLPMKEQHETLQKTLDKWRGDNNQVDDICIFGVRI